MKYLAEGLRAIHDLLLKQGYLGPSIYVPIDEKNPHLYDKPKEDSSTKRENGSKDVPESSNAQSQGEHEAYVSEQVEEAPQDDNCYNAISDDCFMDYDLLQSNDLIKFEEFWPAAEREEERDRHQQ